MKTANRIATRTGFSLLEMLVTVSILAVISGVVIYALDRDNLESSAQETVTKQRLNKIRAAILAFKKDTGYLPKYGTPFQSSNLELNDFVYINNDNHTEENSTPSNLENWSDHEANLWQLFIQPKDSDTADRWDWKRTVAHGWNGPYLNNGLSVSLTDSNTGHRRISALADAHLMSKSAIEWQQDTPPVDSVLTGSIDAMAIGQAIKFIEVVGESDKVYQLVSNGANGVFDDQPNSDDIILEVTRTPK
jgi:prepilin-type N-terminal cleavage/methylation domain-containing protein